MTGTLRRFTIAVLLAAGVAGLAPAQDKPAWRNEVTLQLLNGNFGSYPRSDDHIASAQYYFSPGNTLKVFGEMGLSARFGEKDYPFGGGAYWRAGEKDYLYAYLLFAVNPAVAANADLTAEYTRVLVKALTGSLGYRVMIFPGETVHMLIPALDLYAIRRWTITGRVYVSRLASEPSVHPAFLVRAVYDWTERFAAIAIATAGSEAYRAGSLQDFSAAQSWSAGLGFKIRLGASVRLTGQYEYLRRVGEYQEHVITVSTAFLW